MVEAVLYRLMCVVQRCTATVMITGIYVLLMMFSLSNYVLLINVTALLSLKCR